MKTTMALPNSLCSRYNPYYRPHQYYIFKNIYHALSLIFIGIITIKESIIAIFESAETRKF